MNLVRARSWGQAKPPPGSRIDWGHPLALDLTFCALLNEGVAGCTDLVTGHRSTAAAGASSRGDSVQFASGSSQQFSFGSYTGPATRKAANGQTIAARFAGFAPNFTNVAINAFATATSGNTGLNIGFENGAQVRFFAGDNVTFNASINDGILHNAGQSFDAVGVLHDAARMDLYRGGIRAATTSSSVPHTTVPNFAPRFGNLNDCAVSYGYLWGRAITADEAAWLAVEPYAFIQPPGPKVLYFDLFIPPVGTARTLEAKSATASKLSLSRVAI